MHFFPFGILVKFLEFVDRVRVPLFIFSIDDYLVYCDLVVFFFIVQFLRYVSEESERSTN